MHQKLNAGGYHCVEHPAPAKDHTYLPPASPSNVQLNEHTNQGQYDFENGLKVGRMAVWEGVPRPAPEGFITSSISRHAASAAPAFACFVATAAAASCQC
jgi:hypothetical protein